MENDRALRIECYRYYITDVGLEISQTQYWRELLFCGAYYRKHLISKDIIEVIPDYIKRVFGEHDLTFYVSKVVVVCDRHSNTTGKGHINPVGKGHTTGGTTSSTTPVIGKQQRVVHKDFVPDYTSPLKNVLMEYESGVGGLTYRYVYGLEKTNTVIYNIPNGAGSVMQYAYQDGTGETVLSAKDPGKNINKTNIVKLWYHHNRLGSTDYLSDNVAGKPTSYITYDDWGAPTAKTILKMGVRELDLVTEYTVHPYDQVLDLYFAQARMYNAKDRRFASIDQVNGSAFEPATLVQYVYCINNPIKYVDVTGQYYIKQIKENNKKDEYLAIRESRIAVIGKSAVTALDPTGALSGIFVSGVESSLKYVGGNSLTEITAADITKGMVGSAVNESITVSVGNVSPKAVPYVSAALGVFDFLVEYSAHIEVSKTDDIVFTLLDMCGREIRSTDIIEVVKRMGYAYQFVTDFGWYFYGRVWMQKVHVIVHMSYTSYYNYGDTFWEMDQRIKSAGWLSSPESRIKGYKDEYRRVLHCHYSVTRRLPATYLDLIVWLDDYTGSLGSYLEQWEYRVDVLKESFLKYIDQ